MKGAQALLPALCAILAVTSQAGDIQPEFNQVSSEHFSVYYEAFYPPTGVLSHLESLHAKLLLDLIQFAPWAKDAKIDVYIYKDSDSYHSRTGARPWTGGHANLAERKIFIYQSDNFRRTMAHELAHLFFDDFFTAALDPPSSGTATARGTPAPLWLTEGVATLMEWEYGVGKEYAFSHAQVRMEPLESFLRFDYHNDGHQTRMIEDWYRQAYSLTRFLMRGPYHSGFFAFCECLRRGASIEEALYKSYGYQMRDVQSLEKAWKESLKLED